MLVKVLQLLSITDTLPRSDNVTMYAFSAEKYDNWNDHSL